MQFPMVAVFHRAFDAQKMRRDSQLPKGDKRLEHFACRPNHLWQFFFVKSPLTYV